jgi:broad specificity phosphatase PhoE
VFVGCGKVLDPSRVAHAFISPMTRTRKTFELLLPASYEITNISYTVDIKEWHYGAYEGLTDQEIRDVRRNKGLDQHKKWSIWSDGCEGGEYVTIASTRFITNALKVKARSHRAAG